MRGRVAPLALAIVLASSVALAQAAADTAAARDLFKEGARLAREGKWEEARGSYARSLALKRTPTTLYSLGVAQMSSGQLVEATETFRAFLLEPRSPASDPYQAAARDAIDELSTKIGRLRIDVASPPPSLVVTLDGARLSAAALGLARSVNPGVHELEATAPDHEPWRESITVGEGAEVRAAPRLRPAPRASSDPPPPPPLTAPAPPAPRERNALPYVLLGTGGVLVAGGVTLGISGVLQAKGTPRTSPAADSARTKALLGDLLGGVGLVTAGVGGFVLWTSGGEKDRAAARVEWVGTGVALSGHLGR